MKTPNFNHRASAESASRRIGVSARRFPDSPPLRFFSLYLCASVVFLSGCSTPKTKPTQFPPLPPFPPKYSFKRPPSQAAIVPVPTSFGSVVLTWVGAMPGEENYRVFGATNSVIGGAENPLAFDAGTNLTLKVVVPSGRWYFAAMAFTETAESEFSNEVFADIPAAPVFKAPTLIIESTTNLNQPVWQEFFRLQIER